MRAVIIMGKHRPATPAALIAASAAVQNASFSTSAQTTAAIDTTGANFLVMVCTCYDQAGTMTPSDSKGNTWHSAGKMSSGGINQPCEIFYAYNTALVGSGHTFTNTPSGGSGDGCAGVAAMAFANMPTTDPLISASGTPYHSAAAADPWSSCTNSQTPSQIGDLAIWAMGASQRNGHTIGLDSGFTIASQNLTSITIDIACGYLICTGTSALNPSMTGGGTGGAISTGLALFRHT